jgi:tetratricopeptide (TPR) repeat protein
MLQTNKSGDTPDFMQKFAHDLEALPSSSRLTSVESDVIYSLAVDAVNKNDTEKAARFFSFLTIYNPTNSLYLYGYGFCLRQLGKYDEALQQFSLAASLYPEEAAHTLSIAECLLMKREYAEAHQTLDMLIRFCKFKVADSPEIASQNNQQLDGCLLGDTAKVLLKAEALKNILLSGAAAA